MAKNRKKSQLRILEEIKKQLILQAERWGREGYYTQLRLEEIEQEQCNKIIGELYSEKSNLEYELHLLESDKKELLIKMERLESYIKKAARVNTSHNRRIEKALKLLIGETASRPGIKPRVSILIGAN